MKIIQIITRLDKGGSAESVLEICEYFSSKKPPVKNNYEIVLIYGGEQKLQGVNDPAGRNKLRVKTYYIKELQRSISLVKDIIAFVKIFNIIKNEKPDIVHTHTSKAGILGRWAAFLLRTINFEFRSLKIIHTPHGHIFYGYYNKLVTTIFILIEKITAMITDKLTALTEGEKMESLTYGVGKPTQWSIIHVGVNYPTGYETDYRLEKLKNEFKIEKDDIIVGTVARLEPVKGVEYFVDAIKIITDYRLQIGDSNFLKKLKFMIVGDGSQMGKLKQKVQRLSIQEKVIFTGMRDDVAELISLMDIYVQPSLNEGMGKTIILAQLLGKPVVATKVQGVPSVVLDGTTGILIEPKNPEQLAEAIIKLINDKRFAQQLSKNAKNWVNKIVDGYPQFSIERMIYLLETLYSNVGAEFY